jgi:trk system potassium uptake protein TrkH
MYQILQKIPFLIELFFNGTFILFYSLSNFSKILVKWDYALVDRIIEIGTWFSPLVILLVLVVSFMNCRNLEDFLRKHIFSCFVMVPMIITWGDRQFAFLLATVHLLSSILILYDVDKSTIKTYDTSKTIFQRISLKPAQAILLSFLGVTLIGTFFLMLPLASKNGTGISFVDALFMATSATCVTGLTTLSLEDHFSLFGQIVILTLIQVGGLGIMTLSSSMTILLGRSVAMKDKLMMQDLLEVSSQEKLAGMVVDIIKYTFFIELWGGIVLTIAYTFEDFELGKAIYYGFFHSVSAFCNAGFSLFNTSLESFAANPLINATICVLITLGGLGFIVLKEIKELTLRHKSLARMTLHTKVVLTTSFVLTLGGALFIFFGEFLHALDSYSIWDKIQVSFFQSITLRTAGFNTLPLSNLHSYTLYAMTLFMFIGGSPGSTSGGIKTTTLAVLFQSIVSTLKGRSWVSLFSRTVPPQVVVKATAITFISIIITSFFILIMMKVEPDQSFISIMFEVISASGTVGLSLGITPYLSVFGKIAISAVMLIGRIGPLTLVLAIGDEKESHGKVEFPAGRIMIG